MNKIALAMICACSLLLGGCLHSSKSVFPQHYTLDGGSSGPANGASAAAQQHRSTGHRHYILQIDRIHVPQWLQSTNMYYRLGYKHDAQISAYGRSDWVAPPATLLEGIVQAGISQGGGWRAVVGPGDTAQADVGLQIRLDQFSQNFTGPGASAGVIDASAMLVNNHNASVIAQKQFRIAAPASSADAAGGVKALNQASRKFATQLRNWLRSAPVDQAMRSPQNGQSGR